MIVLIHIFNKKKITLISTHTLTPLKMIYALLSLGEYVLGYVDTLQGFILTLLLLVIISLTTIHLLYCQ